MRKSFKNMIPVLLIVVVVICIVTAFTISTKMGFIVLGSGVFGAVAERVRQVLFK